MKTPGPDHPITIEPNAHRVRVVLRRCRDLRCPQDGEARLACIVGRREVEPLVPQPA